MRFRQLLVYGTLSALALVLSAYSANAQVALMPFTKSQFFGNTGAPLAGGCLFTYAAGTTTPQATFTDFTGSFMNTNPVILDSAGRANVWLGTSAYKFVLSSVGGTNCASGTQQWTEDGIQVSSIALLSMNNTWTGTNTYSAAVTFNSSVTFNAGFTSSGPNTLNGGGTLAGTWTGSPTFSGTPNFANGFTSTTGSFSGQITSTVSTGTAPFVIASTTQVNNLNAALLNGCTWAVPCAIGTTTPNTAIFTTLQANTNFKVGSSPTFTGASGTDTNIMTGGTVSGGAGTGVCLDANNGITTSGCTSTRQIFTGSNSSICTTGSSSYSTCDNTITFSGTFSNSSYRVSCMGVGPSDGRAVVQGIISRTTTTVVVRIVTEGSVGITYNSIECTGVL